MLKQIEQIIAEVTKIQLNYARDYFETGKVKKVDLSQPLAEVSLSDILKYRLTLHESLNDYLIFADLEATNFQYRVKSSEAIREKVKCFSQTSYPTGLILNDILGLRIVLPDAELGKLFSQLTIWKETFGLINWEVNYAQNGITVSFYFKGKHNFDYPWELQIWDEKAKQSLLN